MGVKNQESDKSDDGMELSSRISIVKNIVNFDDNINRQTAFELKTALLSLFYEGEKNIALMINSDGGCVEDGFSIFDTITDINKSGGNIITFGRGYVSSMSFVLLQAGKERLCSKNSTLIMHQPIIPVNEGTNLSKFISHAEFEKKYYERMKKVICAKSKMSSVQF